MATVTASANFSNVDVEISEWVNPAVTPGFFDNANFVAPSGSVYQDYAQSLFTTDNYRTVWAGTGLAWNAGNHTLTAGTISGIFGQNLVGGNWVTEFSIEGFSVAATLVSAALNSTGTADDRTLIASVFAGADTFNLSGEADTVDGYAGNDTLNGNGGNDLLQGGTGNDRVNGGTGTDWAVYRDAGAAVRVVLGAAGAQNTVGAGSDTLVSIEGVLGSAFADTLSGSSGNGVFELFSGGAGNDTINGGVISDTVNYTDGNQVEYWPTAASGVNVNLKTGIASDGQGGTDRLINIDFVIGTGFNDTMTGSDGTLFEAFTGLGGNDSFNGGSLANGSARINYNSSPAAVIVDLLAGSAQDGYGSVDTFTNINFVRGSNFNDTLRGSNATTYSESFEGRAGNDLIDGRGGIDQARYDNAAAAVNASLVSGSASGGDGVDTLLNIENLRGSAFNDTLTGNAGDNALDGRAGNDTLSGGEGDDTFTGGAGNDNLVGGTQLTFDYVSYTSAGSAVTVNLGTGTASSSTEGTDALSGIEGVFGSAFAEALTGNGSNNYLRGNGGADTLNGGAGTDIADYSTASAAVTVDLQAGTGIAPDGTDVLSAIESAFGSAYNDILRGDGGANSLRGRTGNDTLDGRGGFDRADYRSAAGAVTVSLVSNTSSGADGNDTLISIEDVRGSEFYADRLTGSSAGNILDGMGGNDTLSGGAGNDTLVGGDGNDSLVGGSGSDTLQGGNGNDIYVVAAGDTVSETGTVASTADQVRSSVTWTLGANLERLVLTGSTAINGTGNSLANVLTGNAAANVLSGGARNDTLSGGAGNDVLVGGAGNDSLIGGAGLDSFRFNTALSATTNVDRVADFVAADDRFQLDDLVFAGIGPTGTLATGAFRLGTGAGDANDRIVYNSATGQLFFDADGNGAGAQVLFATLTAGTAVTASDFVII